jgi:hypothetical protein
VRELLGLSPEWIVLVCKAQKSSKDQAGYFGSTMLYEAPSAQCDPFHLRRAAIPGDLLGFCPPENAMF